MELTNTVLIAGTMISVTFSFLALCAAIFSIIKILAWQNTETKLIPVNPFSGELVDSAASTGKSKKTSGLEKLQEELDAIIPKQDDYEADFNNVGVSMNPRVERTPEEDLV